MLKRLILLCLVVIGQWAMAQKITGVITDGETGEPIIGASVIVKESRLGVSTDFDGFFELEYGNIQLPFTLQVSFIGYETTEVEVREPNAKLKIKMKTSALNLEDVTVVEQRITKKQKEEALTVESLDAIAIKETPASSFYEGLGNLKGVDLTSASIGFKIINTRGFNSTSPVRSLQIIDGVDNQAPGLNFSLGNFLGASELDIHRVELIAGASGAFYGPAAFNGVISMTTKDPFLFPGASVQIKAGERNLAETAVRAAHVFQNAEGEDKFAVKINLYYLRADDWEATNYEAVDRSSVTTGNLGGWDAVNIYGDEHRTTQSNDYTSIADQRDYPGLGVIFQSGYKEEDLVDYDTRNAKFATSLHYRFNPDLELIFAFNYGTGTTVYQGENRFSLKNIRFMQNRLELRQKDKFFIRFYATNENAGDSYDAVYTAVKMRDATRPQINDQDAHPQSKWYTQYAQYWASVITPQIKNIPGVQEIYNQSGPFDADALNAILSQPENQEMLAQWHAQTLSFVDSTNIPGLNYFPFFMPGTAAFDSVFNQITTTSLAEGGTRLIDRSALYHLHGEYRFQPEWAEVVVGGNFRQYRPQSEGTIFSDTLEIDESDSTYSRRVIVNSEFGVYAGVTTRFLSESLKFNFTLRADKNQNFDLLFSPALSGVYTVNENNTFRATFSSAIRNPTLQDQYLYYDVGPAILIGNLTGFDSLVTVGSFRKFATSQNPSQLVYFSVDPIQPEKVRTVELGYRGLLFDRVYIDMTAYHSWYQQFIGYKLGVDLEYAPGIGIPSYVQAYRIAANSKDQVTTMGFTAGVNYYLSDIWTLTGNYSFNRIDLHGSDDPIIPAYNTPEHKFNIGANARDFKLPFIDGKRWGFGVNYKWVQGFLFEGSPQFTGFIDSYGLVDAQLNYKIPNWDLFLKLGASNLLDSPVYQVYGGPVVGRMIYFSILYDWANKK